MTVAALAGRLVLRPGVGLPAIASSRATLAGALLRGRPAGRAAQMLPQLFSLCGQAHGVAARLAVGAASSSLASASRQAMPMVQETSIVSVSAATPGSDLAPLAAEALREHIRRVLLDWPCLLGYPEPTAAESLRTCPLFGSTAMAHNGGAALRGWIAREILGQDSAEWLAQWRCDPQGWLHGWCRAARAMPAQMMRAAQADATSIVAGCPSLLPHASVAGMHVLAAEMAADAEFERAPTVAGTPRETGSWSRVAACGDSTGPNAITAAPANAWLRMGARLAEMCALGAQLDDGCCGQPVLASGAVILAPGVALAWTEMARGLLCHWVRLELDDEQAVIRDYRIVAPTEWNFHPHGAVAQALMAMPAGGSTSARMATARRIGVLAAAFDPCVNFEIEFAHA